MRQKETTIFKLISQLFGRDEAEVEPRGSGGASTATTETCVHEALSADSPEPGRVGNEDAITEERCDACGSSMTPERARMLQQERVARLSSSGF